MKFKRFSQLDENVNVHARPLYFNGADDETLFRFSIRSRTTNYIAYTKKTDDRNDIIMYILTRKMINYMGYSNIRTLDPATPEYVYVRSIETFINGRDFRAGDVQEIIHSLDYFADILKLIKKVKFKTYEGFYNYLTLKKGFSEQQFNYITHSRYSEYTSQVKANRKNNDDVKKIVVGGNIIIVSDSIPKKQYDLMEKGLNITYRVLKRRGLESLFVDTEIIIRKIGGKAWGLYYPNEKNIIIDPAKRINHKSFVRTLIHEIGHKVDYELLTMKQRQNIMDKYTEASRKDREGKNSAGKFSNSDDMEKANDFYNHLIKLLDDGRLKFFWKARAKTALGIKKNVFIPHVYVDQLKAYVVAMNDMPLCFQLSKTSKGGNIRYHRLKHSDIYSNVGLMVDGKQFTWGRYFESNYDKNVTSKNGKLIFDNSWFVTDYAKTNVREFWAEMFASVLVGERVEPSVKKFVLETIKGL